MTKPRIAIVGGGHAGVEAACAAARLGAHALLITFDPDQIGAMSCNPAIGGLGKGHLVREIDALDGVLGEAADAAAIHYRMLNRSKGSAVWGPRVQADRALFRRAVQTAVAAYGDALEIVPGEAVALDIAGGRVTGVNLASGSLVAADAVVLCTGTFLGGTLFCGETSQEGGRIGERAALRLASQMRELAIGLSRLKTGTPPRLDGRTIDWAVLAEQPSDADQWTMSPLTGARRNPQVFCAITRTNEQSHAIIRANLHRSPLFSGAIGASGPRYCPSIEDKIHRFGDRDGHQIFLEPEGLATHLVYPNGISTSMPADVQLDFLRSMPGLENVVMEVPGYAVEYNHVDPRSLDTRFAMRGLPNLFCAGQINGTTGYEEAAAQGLMAGMYAASSALDRDPVSLTRDNSYMAVMADDLTLQGVTEPYRMLTARAEYRLRLRANNAATRLTGLGIRAGLIGARRQAAFADRAGRAERLREMMEVSVHPSALPKDRRVREGVGTKPLREWIAGGQAALADIPVLAGYAADPADELLIELCEDAAYAPYIARHEAELRDLRANEAVTIPSSLVFADVPGLSLEMVERLEAARPANLGAAARVRGVTPAALAAVLVAARRAAQAEGVA